ncbi:MAG: TlpA family protein disulfide reductase [Candidatus Heimdallarchaeaceae archaeon]
MKMKKFTNKIAFVLIFLFVLNLSLIPVQSQGASIPFRDMEIQLDNVENYSGVRIVVFFSHTCHACKEEVVTLKQIDDNYNVSIIMLDIYQASVNDTIVDFIEETEAYENWIYGFVTDESYDDYNITLIPTTVVLDELGRTAADIGGIVSYRFLEKSVVNAIEQNTDKYFSERAEDPGGYLDVIFIVIGVIISAVVIYFLVQSIPPRKKKEEQN